MRDYKSLAERFETKGNPKHLNGASEYTADDFTFYFIIAWIDDKNGEREYVVETIKAFFDIHADMILANRIRYKKAPKGAWLEKKGGK